MVLLARRRPCTRASSESRIRTRFFLFREGALEASVDGELGEGEVSSEVDVKEALVLCSVDVEATDVVEAAVAFSLLLQEQKIA